MTEEIDKESLRLEYKIAHEKHDYFGRILWQISSIFLPACLAGFAFGVQQDLPLDRFISLNLVLSVLLLLLLFMTRRLRWLAFVSLQRCEEIERILGMSLVTKQHQANEKEIEIAGIQIKPQRITSKHLNQSVPITLLIVFWGYTAYRFLQNVNWNSLLVTTSS